MSQKIKQDCPGVQWKESFATLEWFDVVDIMESDDQRQVEKAAMIIEHMVTRQPKRWSPHSGRNLLGAYNIKAKGRPTMFVIVNAITTRKSSVNRIFNQAKKGDWSRYNRSVTRLQEIARQCTTAGVDALQIDIEQRYDISVAMDFAVNAVQKLCDRHFCISTNNPKAVDAGSKACRKPPIINCGSVDGRRHL